MANYPGSKKRSEEQRVRKKVAEEKGRPAKERLSEYLDSTTDTFTVYPRGVKKTIHNSVLGQSYEPELMVKARMAEGKDKTATGRATTRDRARVSLINEMGAERFGNEKDSFASEYLAKERQRMDELADQYKRERRGMKKGGAVKKKSSSPASKRADGIAQRGKTKGRFV